jgi:hypothetical protein
LWGNQTYNISVCDIVKLHVQYNPPNPTTNKDCKALEEKVLFDHLWPSSIDPPKPTLPFFEGKCVVQKENKTPVTHDCICGKEECAQIIGFILHLD